MAATTTTIPIGDDSHVLTPFYWARTPGDRKKRGVRIQCGKRDVFIPDHEILPLATALADHLEGIKR